MSNRYFVILEFLVSHLSVRNIESCALVRAYPNTCLINIQIILIDNQLGNYYCIKIFESNISKSEKDKEVGFFR